MSIKTAIVARLAADATIQSLVSTRIRIGRAHQTDALPRIVVSQIDGDHKEHLAAATGKVIGRYQVDCYAGTPKKAHEVADAVRERMHGWRGLSDDTFISMVALNDERDGYDPPLPGQDTEGGVDYVQQDYMIGWTTSIPTF